MKHEFKIVVTWEEEGIDSDGKPFSCPVVSLDGYPIGCVQELKFHATADNIQPEIEITFPDLTNQNINPVYHQKAQHVHGNWYFGGGSGFVDSISETVDKLSNTPIIVKLQSLNTTEAKLATILGQNRDVVFLREIGTDGTIDWVPVNK